MYNALKTENGSVLLESVLLLPVVLLALLAAGQFAHIWYARQLVTYAAYTGDRAALTADGDAIEAARLSARDICSVITLSGESEADLPLPWIGTVTGSGEVDQNMTVTVSETQNQFCSVSVSMDFPLIFPVVNQILSGLIRYVYATDLSSWSLRAGTPADPFYSHNGASFPYLRIEQTALLPKPFNAVD